MQSISPTLQNEIISRLVDEFHPDMIYLFGPHARGKPEEGSDLDLILIVSTGSASRAKYGEPADGDQSTQTTGPKAK